MPDTLKAKIFISCGQKKGTDEEGIANDIVKRLEEEGFEPYLAVAQQSLSGLKENIFDALKSSEYFLFIDFKREKLNDTSRNGKEEEFRGSLFCHQELAIASFRDMPFLGFQEQGVKTKDGILQFLQGNCIQFSDRHTLANVIADKIKLAEWKTGWKNQLVMGRDAGQCSDAVIRGILHRFFHIIVKNLNPYTDARNCYAYLEKIRNLKDGSERTHKTVEIKWAGYGYPFATILRASSRDIDGCFVLHGEPCTARLNLFTDSGHYASPFEVKGPGDYELTYKIVSDNFTPASAVFKLHLGNTLSDISFDKA